MSLVEIGKISYNMTKDQIKIGLLIIITTTLLYIAHWLTT